MIISAYVRLDLTSLGGENYLFSYPKEVVQFDSIPALQSISVRPAKLDPGRSLGERETVSINIKDFLHVFDTESFTAGTFWTKFRARFPSLQGQLISVFRGEEGDALAEMERRDYIIDRIQINETGADISAKDPLYLLRSKASQAPNVNTGELLAAIDEDDLSFTLSPAGIGNLEYPASGRLCIGGEEIVSFTRSGDTVTLSSRGENLGGTGIAHDEETKVQLVLEYDTATPSEIINDLLTNYTTVDASWIPLTEWQEQVDDYIARNFGAQIPVPTSVIKLMDELCEQVGLIMYWDAVARLIRLKPLAPPSSGFIVNTSNLMGGSFDVQEQPDKRVSQAWVYYGQRDPTKKIDEENNYRRISVTIADNETDYPEPAIKKTFSRWISINARTTAERLGDLIIGRYKIPPRAFTFSLWRTGEALPRLGNTLTINHWRLVDGDGVLAPVISQVLTAQPKDDSTAYSAEEVLFESPPDEGNDSRIIPIDGDRFNLNLKDVHDSIYSTEPDAVTFIVESGARVGSTSISAPAIDVGTWDLSTDVKIINNGRIQGKGGDGALGQFGSTPDGEDGGVALFTDQAITVDNTSGSILGGAGGGGLTRTTHAYPGTTVWKYYPGGGGAGFLPGNGHADVPPVPNNEVVVGSNPGTTTAGGAAGYARGAGGNPGEDGEDGFTRAPILLGTAGGSAGAAVDGDSLITWDVEGTITGQRIN